MVRRLMKWSDEKSSSDSVKKFIKKIHLEQRKIHRKMDETAVLPPPRPPLIYTALSAFPSKSVRIYKDEQKELIKTEAFGRALGIVKVRSRRSQRVEITQRRLESVIRHLKLTEKEGGTYVQVHFRTRV